MSFFLFKILTFSVQNIEVLEVKLVKMPTQNAEKTTEGSQLLFSGHFFKVMYTSNK